MKMITKRKLIRWFGKLIRYDITKDMVRFIQIEERKVQRIKHEHIYSNHELIMITEEQIRFASGLSILTILNDQNFIKYERTPEEDSAYTKITAELKIILP